MSVADIHNQPLIVVLYGIYRLYVIYCDINGEHS